MMQSSQYRAVAFEHHGRECEDCGATENLHVHHKDRDRENNEPENLQVLCEEHHWDRHRDEVAERASGARKQTDSRESNSRVVESASPAQRESLKLLREGRVTAPFVAEQADYSLQYVREELTDLVQHDHVEKIHDGLYELVDDPREGGDG